MPRDGRAFGISTTVAEGEAKDAGVGRVTEEWEEGAKSPSLKKEECPRAVMAQGWPKVKWLRWEEGQYPDGGNSRVE